MDGSGNIYVTGESDGIGILLLLLLNTIQPANSNGFVKYNGNYLDNSIIADDSGNVYVTGAGLGSGNGL